jgi:ABC-type nitrate/sulfonate/bicarbonate transport system substrate-binding protein
MLAALKSKQLDAIAISPPAPETAEVEGAGTLVISLSRGDVPELGNIPYDVLLVHREYVAKNADTVRRVVRALGRGARVMRENPGLAKESLLKYFDKTPPAMDAGGEEPPDGVRRRQAADRRDKNHRVREGEEEPIADPKEGAGPANSSAR